MISASMVASACSDRAPVQAIDYANGRRLAVRYDEMAGGLKIFRSFYDTQLDEECQFRLVPDGARCLPTSALENGWFADAACSEALVEMPAASLGVQAAAVVDDPVNACESAPTVRELGDRVWFDHAYQISKGSCVLVPVHGAELHRIGATVPLERFVHATVQVEPVPDRIGAVVIVADDGSRQTAFGYDQQRGEWSRAAPAEDGTRRWWPVHVAFNYGQGAPGTPGTVYADPACAQPTGVKDTHDALCPITSVVEFAPGDACEQFRPRVHVSGAVIAADHLYARAPDGSCQPDVAAAADPASAIYVEMGALLPPETFAPATVVDVGGGRIVERFDGTPSGVAVTPQPGGLFDRERGERCFVYPAADGQRRCLPGDLLDGIDFADPACTTAMFPIGQLDGCTVDPVPPAETTFQGRAYRVVGALQPSMVYYKSADGGCAPIGPSPSYDRWFQLGDEIPATAFAAAAERTH